MSTNTADKLKALQEKNALNSINRIEAKLITLKQQAKEISDAKSRASLKGDKGDPGEDGEDGREIELRKTEEYIQWKYTDEIEWQNLISLEELKGEKGDKPRFGYDYIVMHGKDGHDGRVGDSGYTPIKGVDYFDGATGPQGIQGLTGPTDYSLVIAYAIAL